MKWWVTGAAGFIGTNLVSYLIEQGHEVVGVDDLSREGSQRNAAYLLSTYGFTITLGDISKSTTWSSLHRENGVPDAVAHLAGQVSLMTSIANPRRDFEVNALGTLNALEFVRMHAPEAALIGMSSNKVYGDLSTVDFVEEEFKYVAPSHPLGFNESLPLDFHGPYGCSKGSADQYMVDYGRMFGLRTVSLRQSSVYGPHQHPRADQGWVAYLLAEAKGRNEIRLNGQGKQVRDLLHARDLAQLISLLGANLPIGGLAVNVGGGPRNSLSILELFGWVKEQQGIDVSFTMGQLRPSDQKVFIADMGRLHSLIAWHPSVELEQGLREVWSSTCL